MVVSAATQHRAQVRLGAAQAAWREAFVLAEIEAGLAEYAGGATLCEVPALARLFEPECDAAHSLVAGFIEGIAAALVDDPLGQLSHRHRLDAASATLVLARGGSAILSLQAVADAVLSRRPPPHSVVFTPGETAERVLAGSGTAHRIAAGPRLVSAPVALRPGTVLRRDSRSEALQIERAEGLLLLKLQRRAAQAEPAREYCLATGKLLRSAAGHPRESRLELAAALLGQMQRVDAAPQLAALAQENGAEALRWQALRQCLALDTSEGFAALCRIARDLADPLAAHAGALRAQLLEAHPQLAAVEPCRAF